MRVCYCKETSNTTYIQTISCEKAMNCICPGQGGGASVAYPKNTGREPGMHPNGIPVYCRVPCTHTFTIMGNPPTRFHFLNLFFWGGGYIMSSSCQQETSENPHVL